MPTDNSRVIFERPQKVQWKLDDERWVDLYALLEVPRESRRREIEDAIISRGADVLLFTVGRGRESGLVRALERYSPDFRPILLDTANRRHYDEQLAFHENGDPRGQNYDDWQRDILALSTAARLARQLKDSSRSAWERITRTWRESEYI